jgi:hypothetical protein
MDRNADEFFLRLNEGVTSIEDLRLSELVTTAMAEASLKRFIHDPLKLTRVRDLVLQEASQIRQSIEGETEEFYTIKVSRDSLVARLEHYERETELLRALYISGCYWGGPEHIRSWVLGLERLASLSSLLISHFPAWSDLRYYPAVLTLYSGGMAALAGEQYQTLSSLLKDTVANSRVSVGPELLIYTINTSNLIDSPAIRLLAAPGHEDRAVSSYMSESTTAWSNFSQYVPDPSQWNMLFDQFEYILGLVYADHIFKQRGALTWAPPGNLGLGRIYGGNLEAVQSLIASQIESFGEEMPLLKAGLFDGSLGQLQNIKQRFDEILSQPRW